jgi:hypothetical protein
MERRTREDKRAQAISPKFDHLTQFVYLTSGTAAAFGVVASLLCSNAGLALAGISTAGLSLYVLGPSRERAAQTAATLLVSNDEAWEQELAAVATQVQAQINALASERDTLRGDHLKLSQQLAQSHAQQTEQQRQSDAQKAEISRLQSERRSTEQALSTQLKQVQAALKRAQDTLTEKRHELAVHLDAIEVQLLDIWHPLYSGLIAICDRFDPSRPVSTLEYAGKPVTLDAKEKRQWQHYRDSLVVYDANLRERITRMSDDCESHDEAYGFFLRLLEELTVNYCKLWANIKDLELVTVHEGEKQAIYSEFENFRSDYVSEASTWVDQSTKVEAGFDLIEQSFKNELASLQQRIVDAEQLIEVLQAPHKFRGETSVDQAGNKIIEHFASSGVVLDAIESVKIPGGFRLRFKVDRNPDSTRLAESEFDKHCEHLGLWGLSQRPLDFHLDTRNFLLSVNLYVAPEGKQRPAAVTESKRASVTAAAAAPEVIAERFQDLHCYTADEFEAVVRLKFVPRVRVVAGSTGGKSPLLELIACAIAQSHKGELWLLNPIPGSPKDWFHVPGVIAPGSDGMQAAIAWLRKAHQEFTTRRNDLPGTAAKPFITVVVDEINAIARDFPDLGTVIKDFYQLSDHTRMGFLTAGQGGNVSGVSGGSKSASKTGNASKLMAEDFQNATQVFTAQAAKVWLEQHLKGSQARAFLDRLAALNALCAELNRAEGKSDAPTDPTVKKVSPDAYRIALVVSPREPEPFFVQLPPYSSYLGQLEGITYPPGAIVTAPKANQQALGLLECGKPQSFSCEFCSGTTTRRKGTYKATGKPRYVCSHCGRVPSTVD